MLTVGVAFHVVAAVIWVGGMFFALVVLRPATGPLEPPVRLRFGSAFSQASFCGSGQRL